MTDGTGTNEAASANLTVEPAEPAEEKPRSPWRRRLIWIGVVAILIAAAAVLPPLFNISRYQRQITALMTRALGRPVHMSSVELRILPRPGFVLNDLSVNEDPSFGAEPILVARSVAASVGMISLWRGKLEITRISVDEASLNLVRNEQGRWNLESWMTGGMTGGATGRPDSDGNIPPAFNRVRSGAAVRFPYLTASNSQVHLKNGIEKTPFTILDTDLSLWQDEPGKWRIRLSGQPARTDMQMSPGDRGDLRLDGTLQTGAARRDMPLSLDLEWREAQLGQLSRLLFGSDAGWRGDLTADFHVEGTLEAAKTRARLRAAGVRREEFAPESPIDLDTNCTLVYQRSQNAIHDLTCNSSIGGGQLHLTANIPSNPMDTEAMLEAKQLPLQVGLDFLRTVRRGLAPGISVSGRIDGRLAYKGKISAPVTTRLRKHGGATSRSVPPPPSTHLTGELVAEGAVFRGGRLTEPITFPKVTLAPAQLQNSANTPSTEIAAPDLWGSALEARFSVPLGPSTPAQPASSSKAATTPALSSKAKSTAGKQPAKLRSATSEPQNSDANQQASGDAESAETAGLDGSASAQSTISSQTVQSVSVTLNLNLQGYSSIVSGSGTIRKLRDLAYAFGTPRLDAADSFDSGSADFDFIAAGPWIPAEGASGQPIVALRPAMLSGSATVSSIQQNSDTLAGSLHLHRAVWKAPFLARPVDLPQATVVFSASDLTMAADFSFGGANEAVTGSAVVKASIDCKSPECEPQVQLRFTSLDTATLQSALLGAPTRRSLLSPLIDRMRATPQTKWPSLALTAQADNLTIGPTTLRQPSAQMRISESEIVIEHWDASILGGTATGKGHFAWTANRPEYSVDGSFAKLDGGFRWPVTRRQVVWWFRQRNGKNPNLRRDC